jgi:hypothetical protein
MTGNARSDWKKWAAAHPPTRVGKCATCARPRAAKALAEALTVFAEMRAAGVPAPARSDLLEKLRAEYGLTVSESSLRRHFRDCIPDLAREAYGKA